MFMYTHVHVCIHRFLGAWSVYIYIYIFIIYIHKKTCLYTCIHTRIYIFVYIYIYIWTWMYIYAHIYREMYTYIYLCLWYRCFSNSPSFVLEFAAGASCSPQAATLSPKLYVCSLQATFHEHHHHQSNKICLQFQRLQRSKKNLIRIWFMIFESDKNLIHNIFFSSWVL